MTIKRNRIANADVCERYYYLAMAIRAQLRHKRLGIPKRTLDSIIADYGLRRGGQTAVCIKLAQQEQMPTMEDVIAARDAYIKHKEELRHAQKAPSAEELKALEDARAAREAADAKIKAFYDKFPQRRKDSGLKMSPDRNFDLFNC